MISTAEIIELARGVARRYRRRCWHADVEELTQVGVTAELAALHQVDQSDPAALAYLKRVAAVAMRDSLLRSASPVSARDPGKLVGTRSCVVGTSESDEAGTYFPAAPGTPVDEKVLDAHWEHAARRRLATVTETASGEPNRQRASESLPWGVMRDHLLGEDPPRVVARRYGVPVRIVYRITRELRRAVEEDRELYRLTRERCR